MSNTNMSEDLEILESRMQDRIDSIRIRTSFLYVVIFYFNFALVLFGKYRIMNLVGTLATIAGILIFIFWSNGTGKINYNID